MVLNFVSVLHILSNNILFEQTFRSLKIVNYFIPIAKKYPDARWLFEHSHLVRSMPPDSDNFYAPSVPSEPRPSHPTRPAAGAVPGPSTQRDYQRILRSPAPLWNRSPPRASRNHRALTFPVHCPPAPELSGVPALESQVKTPWTPSSLSSAIRCLLEARSRRGRRHAAAPKILHSHPRTRPRPSPEPIRRDKIPNQRTRRLLSTVRSRGRPSRSPGPANTWEPTLAIGEGRGDAHP
jgi:hypothetical protein